MRIKNILSSHRYVIFFLILALLVFFNIFMLGQQFLKNLQLGELKDTFNVYQYAINDTKQKHMTPEEIVDYMVYIKMYYPVGTKYVSTKGELAEVIEEGRTMTLLLLKYNLEEKLMVKLENDFNSIINKYGTERTKINYKQFQPIDNVHNNDHEQGNDM